MGRDRRPISGLLAGVLLSFAVVCGGASCSRRGGEQDRPEGPAEHVAPPSSGDVSPPRVAPPAPRAPSTSVTVRTREAKPAPAADAGPSLFEKALELNMVLEPELDGGRVREAFDGIVSRARAGLVGAVLPRDKIKVLNRVLFTDRKVSYLSNKYWRDGTLAASVLRRRGNCMSMSTLYVLVAGELGLPVRLVVIPEHAFVRWDDGETRINIETVAGGAEVPDERYASRHPYTPEDKAVLGFGESQDADGFHAELLLNAARHRCGENRLPEAVAYVDKALALKPRRLDVKLWRAQLRSDITSDRRRFRREVTAMLRNDDLPPGVAAGALAALATDYGATGDHESERRVLMRAFAVAPKYKQEELLQSLAFCHRALKDFRGAVRYMELALALLPDPRDPSRPRALYNLAILQKNDGRLGDALASIDEAMRHNPEMWSLKIIKAGYLVLDGRREEGLALFERIKDDKPRGQEEFYNIMIAWFHAVSRQREEFYRAFGHALATSKTTGVLHWIDQDVDLDVYRDEPEFKVLVAKHRARLLGRSPVPGRAPRGGAGEPDRQPAEAESVR